MLNLPPNAPFSGAQRMWIQGFLDGINSTILPVSGNTVEKPAAPASAGQPVTILWGSQTGNSQTLGKKLSKTLAAKGHSPTLRNMAEVTPADLLEVEKLLIITSTYGDGEPPDNAAALHSALHAVDAPQLPKLKFSVLALGDSNYAEFCKCGRDFHTRLSALGAKPIIDLIESDVDYEEPFAAWISQLEQALTAA
jgi:sulfite reductase (NADPH) flavoprotein alpha-component